MSAWFTTKTAERKPDIAHIFIIYIYIYTCNYNLLMHCNCDSMMVYVIPVSLYYVKKFGYKPNMEYYLIILSHYIIPRHLCSLHIVSPKAHDYSNYVDIPAYYIYIINHRDHNSIIPFNQIIHSIPFFLILIKWSCPQNGSAPREDILMGLFIVGISHGTPLRILR